LLFFVSCLSRLIKRSISATRAIIRSSQPLSPTAPRTALSAGIDEPAVQKGLGDLDGVIAEPDRHGPKALAELVHSEIVRLTPILTAAKAK
jgi:hypothetical protein